MKVFNKGLILFLILLFSYVLVVTGAGATLRGNSISYESPGQIEGLANISLRNTPLVIADSVTGGLIAVFNAPSNFTAEIVSQMEVGNTTFFFPNTSTSLLGDVNNFDDINAQSRFRETNINNGTSASAAFVAVNDVGFTTAMGIGSSNFAFGGLELNNFGTIFHLSPAGFNFANGFFEGWNWIANLDDTNSSFNFSTAMQLSPGGNLNISGNLTINETAVYLFSEQPPGITGHVRMFCKSDNKCYIIRDDGTQRRLLDSGAGSDIIDEQWTFNVTPIFSDMIGTYVGGQAYACVYDNGTLFSSESAC